MGQCEPAYRSLKCEAFWSERRFESDGTVSWKPETREYLYAILDTQNGGVGESGPPCQGYVAGLGCPTPAADRTRDAAAGSCSEPSGLTLVPQCMQHPKVGNPISLSNGAKVESRQDLSWPIAFIRSYSSANNRFYSLSNWRHNHESFAIFAKRSLPAPAAPFVAAINFRLEDGQDVAFTRTSPSAPFAAAYYDQKQYVASANALGYQLTLPSGEARQYDATGLMAARTWPSGYSLAYAYDARRRLSTISDSYARGLRIEYLGESSFIAQVASAGGASSDNVSYSYYNGFLTSASFNGGPPESYAYDSQGRMTSIADELGTTYAQFEYDPATGKAIQSKHLLGGLGGEAVSQTDVAYGASSITVSRNGAVDVYSVSRDHVNYKTLITGASLAGGASTYSVEYSNGVATGSSAGYQSTSFSLDAATQLPTSKRDARGTTTYQWDAARRLLTSLVEPAPQGSRSVSMAYDAFGNMTSQTISSSQSGARTLTKTYGSLGKVLTATSSDGSTATLEYYPDDDAGSLARRGQLKSASNALGQKTTFDEYDERGRAIAITDANGVQSTLAFDDRGRVLSYGRLGSSISASYDAAGQLSAIQYSNGYSISFGYDDAHRRTSIADSRGDSLAIVYDANGNPIQESATQNSTLVSVANRTFTALGQLSAAWETNPAEKRSIGYDVNGWATSATDGLGRASTQSYNADGQPTGHSSPGISNVTTNRDVDGNMTSYGAKMSAAWNDFGEILRLSTDYAGNKTFSHDHANRSSSFTDAAGIAHADFMDALGRPTLSTHVLGAQSMSESVVYDTGRLGLPSSITDSASTQSWTWSERGLPLTKTQAVGASTLSLSYAYDGEGQLQSITYPSGMVVQYEWSSGRLASVLVNGQPFMANLGYRPFSTAPTSWTWGSGGMRALSFDGDGKISGLADSGILSQATSFDAAMRLASLTDGSATMSASYSPADQLAQFSVGGQSQSFTYDAGLNRFTKKNFNGLVDTTYVGEANFFGQWSTSSSPAVYRSIAYDSRKNMTNNGRSALSYDLRGDLATATGAGYAASYAYNAQHQRVSKTVNGAQTFFLYDEAGNLAGEYAAGGAPIAEHIYVGSLPVGASIGGSILAVHTDYLGTPRALSNGASVAWRWESTDPFGANQPSIQAVVYNPRFPGQYYDQETGLHYNHHRTYDPIFGRYLQPDPLGVAAGKNPLNYVNQNPLNGTDSTGLLQFDKMSTFPIPFPKIEGNKAPWKWDWFFLAWIPVDNLNVNAFSFARLQSQNYVAAELLALKNSGNDVDSSMDCHGLTFGGYPARSLVIDNSQVNIILNGDNYFRVNRREARVGDAVIYVTSDGNRIVHSATLSQVNGNDFTVYQKAGTIPYIGPLPMGPGKNSAWDDTDGSGSVYVAFMRKGGKR